MKKLFKTETNLTLEEFIKYNNAVKNKFYKRKLQIVMTILIIFLVLILNDGKETTIDLIISTIIGLVIGIIVGLFVFKLLDKSSVKRAYKLLIKHNTGIINTKLNFYEDYLEQITDNSNYKLKYDKIYKIIETNDNFYIMITKNQGIVIIKNNCDSKLIDFIKSLNFK